MNRGSWRICEAPEHLQHLMASKRPSNPLHDFVQPPTQGRVLLAARLAHLHSRARRTCQKLARSGLAWRMAASRRSVSASRSCCLGRRRALCWSAGPTHHPAPPRCRQTPSAASLHRGWLPFRRISRPQCIQNLIIQHGRHKLLAMERSQQTTLAACIRAVNHRQTTGNSCLLLGAVRRSLRGWRHRPCATADRPGGTAAAAAQPARHPRLVAHSCTGWRRRWRPAVHAAADNDESDYGRCSTPQRSLPTHIAWQGSDGA